MLPIRHAILAAALLLAAAPAAAEPDPAAAQQMTVARFGELQERGPSTPAELADRARDQANDEAVKADAALNDWKLCVLDAVARWADLAPGPGPLIDGAFGRCGDLERAYRGHLVRITQGGRFLMDLQLARSMVRGLEEAWRPRLTAAVLDDELARRQARAVGAPSPGGTRPPRP